MDGNKLKLSVFYEPGLGLDCCLWVLKRVNGSFFLDTDRKKKYK